MEMETLAEQKVEVRSAKLKRRWDEAWSNQIAAKQNWQRIAFILGIALIVAIYGLIHLGSMRKDVLYVVERDKVNVRYAGPVKPVDLNADTWNILKVQAIYHGIEEWRTVTTDRSAQDNLWDHAYLHVGDGSQARQVLADFYGANDPVRRAASGETVTTQFKTYDVEGDHTYGIWWQETVTRAGQPVSSKLWRARVAYAMRIPSDEQARAENPLGVLATELSVQEVRQ